MPLQSDTTNDTPVSPSSEWLWLAGLLAAWQVLLGWGYAVLGADIVFGSNMFPYGLFGLGDSAAANMSPFAASFFATVAGSGVGGVLNGLYYLQFYAAERGLFDLRYAGSYLLAPLAIPLVGVAAFALVTGGIIIFTPEVAVPDDGNGTAEEALVPDGRNLLAYLALGVLAGVAWQNILARTRTAAENMFGKTNEEVSRDRSSGEEGAPGKEAEGTDPGTVRPQAHEAPPAKPAG